MSKLMLYAAGSSRPGEELLLLLQTSAKELTQVMMGCWEYTAFCACGYIFGTVLLYSI
jgi:hypothetical protein